jgi:hypothetical protein
VSLPELDVRFFNPEVLEEFQALKDRSEALFLACGRLIRSIARQEQEGRPLEKRVSPGDLWDCRKIYFDEQPEAPQPDWRIVFRFRPRDDHRIQLQLIAIGPRKDLEAYRTAVRRLNR